MVFSQNFLPGVTDEPAEAVVHESKAVVAVKDIDRVGDGIDDGREVPLGLDLELQLLLFSLHLPFAYLVMENKAKDPDGDGGHDDHRQNPPPESRR